MIFKGLPPARTMRGQNGLVELEFESDIDHAIYFAGKPVAGTGKERSADQKEALKWLQSLGYSYGDILDKRKEILQVIRGIPISSGSGTIVVPASLTGSDPDIKLEVVQVEATPAPPGQEEVVVRAEVPNLKAPRRIRIPKRRGVIKKRLSAAQRMSAAFDKNFLDKLVDAIRNPSSGPEPKEKPKRSGKTVSKRTYKGLSSGSTISASGGDLVDKGFNRVRKAFGLAARARREFKESGGNPKDLRRGFFLQRTLASELGGDRIRRTKGTFSRNPDETQDPALKREERLAAVLRRDISARPTMMKQGELFDTGEYEDKTLGKRFLELSQEVADKILGIDSSFVRMDKAQKETNTKLNSVSRKLKSVKNVFVKTSSNVSEFIKNKSRSLELKEKLREIFKDDLNREEQREKEAESELQKDVADTIKVKAAGDSVNRPEEGEGGGDGGGFDIDFRGSRKWWRRLRNPRRFFRTLRRFGRLKGGQFVRGAKSLGGKALRFGKGLASRAPGFARGLGSKALRFGKGLGIRALGPSLGRAAALWAVTEGLFPRSAGRGSTLDDVMDAGGKLPGDPGYDKTTAGQAKPGSKPTSVKPDAPKPSSGFGKKVDQAKDLGKNLAGKGKGLLSKCKGAIKKVGGKIATKAGGALGKGLLKKIPGLSIIMGGLFSIDRFAKGDWLGGLGEIASGIASTFPGPGTAISAGIDALLLTKDILTPEKKGDTKLSGGGIIAGEAGNEIIQPLTSSVGRGIMADLSAGASFLPVMGPTLSAASGIVNNPLYGKALGPVINPIIQPLISKYNIPTFAADLGSFKADKVKSATTQAQTKDNVSKQGKKKGGGILGGIMNFFKNLFGGGKKKTGSNFSPSTTPGLITPSSGGNGSGYTSAGAVYNYLLSKGMSENHAKGITANISRESGFKLGAHNPNDPGAGSFGLFQWNAGRATNMMAAVPNWETNWKGQIDYALGEDHGPRYLSTQFNSAGEAAYDWMKYWERPAASVQRKYTPQAYEQMISEMDLTAPTPQSPASTPQSAGPTPEHQGPVIKAADTSSTSNAAPVISAASEEAPTPIPMSPNLEAAMSGGGIRFVPFPMGSSMQVASTGDGDTSRGGGSSSGLTMADIYKIKLQNT